MNKKQHLNYIFWFSVGMGTVAMWIWLGQEKENDAEHHPDYNNLPKEEMQAPDFATMKLSDENYNLLVNQFEAQQHIIIDLDEMFFDEEEEGETPINLTSIRFSPDNSPDFDYRLTFVYNHDFSEYEEFIGLRLKAHQMTSLWFQKCYFSDLDLETFSPNLCPRHLSWQFTPGSFMHRYKNWFVDYYLNHLKMQ